MRSRCFHQNLFLELFIVEVITGKQRTRSRGCCWRRVSSICYHIQLSTVCFICNYRVSWYLICYQGHSYLIIFNLEQPQRFFLSSLTVKHILFLPCVWLKGNHSVSQVMNIWNICIKRVNLLIALSHNSIGLHTQPTNQPTIKREYCY